MYLLQTLWKDDLWWSFQIPIHLNLGLRLTAWKLMGHLFSSKWKVRPSTLGKLLHIAERVMSDTLDSHWSCSSTTRLGNWHIRSHEPTTNKRMVPLCSVAKHLMSFPWAALSRSKDIWSQRNKKKPTPQDMIPCSTSAQFASICWDWNAGTSRCIRYFM